MSIATRKPNLRLMINTLIQYNILIFLADKKEITLLLGLLPILLSKVTMAICENETEIVWQNTLVVNPMNEVR